MKAVTALAGFALLATVLVPLHSDVAGWAWSGWLLAAACAHAGARQAAGGAALQMRPVLAPAVLAAGGCLLAACLIEAAMGAWHQEGWRTMRQDGKVLLALPIAWLLLGHAQALPPMRTTLCWALGLQMGVAMVVALTWPRANLPATPIPWATAVALGLAVLAPMVVMHENLKPGSRAWRVGLGLALTAGAVAVVWSRSRAAWVVLPWLLVVFVGLSQRRGRAALLAALVSVLALGAGVWHDSRQPEQVERGMRLLDLVQELQQVGQPDAGTSVGSRLLLWQAAWHSLIDHPLAGIGLGDRIALVQQVVPPDRQMGVAPLVHVHQQYLNQAVDHGIPGLIAAVLSASAPLLLALRAGPGLLRWQCAGIGVVHAVGLLFNANMTHGTYAFNLALALIAALLMQQQGRPESAGPAHA